MKHSLAQQVRRLIRLDHVIDRQFSKARLQKCVTHLKRNIQSCVRSTDKNAIAEELRQIFLTGQKHYSPEEAMENFRAFARRWGKRYRRIARMANND